MKDFLTELLYRLLQPLTIRFWNKHADHVITPLTDLAPCFIHADLDAKVLKGSTPCFCMQSVAVHKGSVYVGEQNVGHAVSSAVAKRRDALPT
jgi:hypothetical protein